VRILLRGRGLLRQSGADADTSFPPGLRRAGWRYYVVLVAGGLKLVLEDLPTGRPMTLFVSFVFYGAALLLIPRLMRTEKGSAAEAR